MESCLISRTTFYDLHSCLYILGHIWCPPFTSLFRTDGLLKLCCPQGLGRCHLLHMCITAYMKYLAFALTGMHCFFHSACQIWNRTCWKLNLSSSMPAALPSSVPSVCLVSLLSVQWWWQSSAECLGNGVLISGRYFWASHRSTGHLCEVDNLCHQEGDKIWALAPTAAMLWALQSKEEAWASWGAGEGWSCQSPGCHEGWMSWGSNKVISHAHRKSSKSQTQLALD